MHAPSSAPPATRTPLFGLTLAMGLMLSPDWLVILGNNVGLADVVFLGALVAVGVIYWLA
jgi:hypothetical protein